MAYTWVDGTPNTTALYHSSIRLRLAYSTATTGNSVSITYYYVVQSRLDTSPAEAISLTLYLTYGMTPGASSSAQARVDTIAQSVGVWVDEFSTSPVTQVIGKGTTQKTCTLSCTSLIMNATVGPSVSTTLTIDPLATYDVTFYKNADGITVSNMPSPNPQVKTYGQTLTLSTSKPTRNDEYRFLNWNTQSNGKGTTYASGATYSSNAAANLYAIWKLGYTSPVITSVTCDRCRADGALDDEGTYALVKANWSVNTDNYPSNTGKNASISITVGSTTKTAQLDLVSQGASGNLGSSGIVVGDGTFDPETSYEGTLKVTDTQKDPNGTTVILTLPSAQYPIDVSFDENTGDYSVGILSVAPNDGTVQVGGNINIRKSDAAFGQKCIDVVAKIGDSVPSGNKRMAGQYMYDSAGYNCYYSELYRTSGDDLYRSYVVKRPSSDGSTNYTNGFYLHVNSSGTPTVSFTSGGAAAWRDGLGLGTMATQSSSSYLPLSGGTMTGAINRKGTVTDITTANNGGTNWNPVPIAIKDKNDQPMGYLQWYSHTDGYDYVALDARNQPTGGGTAVVNYLRLRVNKDGAMVVQVASAPAWRTALGLGAAATMETGTTASTVALGNHTHAASAITSGTIDAARLSSARMHRSSHGVITVATTKPTAASTSGWNYDKYSDGLVHAWGSFKVSNTAINTKLGDGFYWNSTMMYLALPAKANFIMSEHFSMSMGGSAGAGAYVMPGGNDTDTSPNARWTATTFSLPFYIARPVSTTAGNWWFTVDVWYLSV